MSENTSPITAFREAQTPKKMTLEEFGKLFDPPVHKATVLRWERQGVDAKRALEIEKRTGIPRADLLPEVFGEMA